MIFLKILALLFLTTICVSSQKVTNDRPFLRIVAPKYLCDDPSKSSKNETGSSNKLTVGLQTREGQRLKYRISIDFTLLEGFKNQRHTLSIWKNVRELQAKFAQQDISDEITLRNQIEIDALELTPQVVYTFKIIGYDENNLASDEQNFTITYKGDQLQAVHSNVGEGVSLLLYGPETFYNDLDFIAVADVLFCDPINDYYYQWKIDGITSDAFKDEYLSGKSSYLKLPPDILDDGSYEVGVTIFNNNSQALASLSMSIQILSKDINTQNIPADCSVGVNREVPFVTALYRKSMSQNVNVKWTCSIEETECPNVFTNSTEALQISAIFPNEGRYSLSTDVTFKGTTVKSNTKVLADSKIIPHVEIKYFPQQPVSVVDSTEIVATIMDLVPKCIAYWNVVIDEDDYAKPKNESMNNVGLISIKDYEEHFLQELVDYDNNTLSKDTTLEIPANSLYPDSKYKFRLNVICPEPITDIMSPSDRKNITTYFDVAIETNGPPKALPLIVLPLTGIPMKDEFTFKTGAAKERQSDYPLKYSFSYQIDDLVINIGTFYEFQVARTQLPYSDAIHTFMQVTDNNNASVFVKGPKIKANRTHKFTEKEINFKLEEIRGTLKRSEYSKTLNSAVVFILTQRKFASPEDAKKYEELVYQMLQIELKSLKSTTTSTFAHRQNVIEFVKMIKKLLIVMTVYDEPFVEDVLSLTEAQSQRTRRMVALSNSMRNRNIMTNDPDYIENVLSLSDMLISSSNIETVQRERKKYVGKIHKFIASLCQEQYLNSHVIQSKFAVFEVSKIYSRQLYIVPQQFPNDTANAIFTSNPYFPSKFVCIGKVKFMIDMFNESLKENVEDIIYETQILDDVNGQKVAFQGDSVGEYVVMEMPVKNRTANEQTCFMWSKNHWSSNECEKQVLNESTIICKCKTADSIVVKYRKSSMNDLEKKPIDGEKITTTQPTKTTETEKVSVTSVQSVSDGITATSSTSFEGYLTTPTNDKKVSSTTTNAGSAITGNQQNSELETSTLSITTASMTPESFRTPTTNSYISTTSSDSLKTTTNVYDSSTLTSSVEVPKSSPLTTSTEMPNSSPSTTDITRTQLNTANTTKSSESSSYATKSQSTTENVQNKPYATTKYQQATENPIRSSTEVYSTGVHTTTIESEKSQLSSTVSKQMEATTISYTKATDGTKQTTTEKNVDKDLNNQKDMTEGSVEKSSTKSSESKDKLQLDATTVASTSIVTKENSQATNTTSAEVTTANFGLNTWFVVLILCLFFGLIILLIILHRCRRFSEAYINLPMRHPSDNIKYAKYHDEFIMRG